MLYARTLIAAADVAIVVSDGDNMQVRQYALLRVTMRSYIIRNVRSILIGNSGAF